VRGLNRFRREVTDHASFAHSEATLIEHLRARDYPEAFIVDYLLPLAAAVWSGSGTDAASMPLGTFLHFLANHGLFELERPQWQTVSEGSREYVERVAKEIPRVRTAVDVRSVARAIDGVVVTTADGAEQFDDVVLATHAPQTVDLLGDDLARDERNILGAFRYAPNRAVVHRDPATMPRRRAAWSAWNAVGTPPGSNDPISVTYWMNRLQNLDDRHPVFVTLNPAHEPRDIIEDVWYSHPQFDLGTDRAQRRLPEIQGRGGVWYCGAWTGYGFHEDGLQSGLTVADALGSPAPWHDDIVPASPAAVAAAPARGLVRA
jgi:predicted NAD/FAD-binding protein